MNVVCMTGGGCFCAAQVDALQHFTGRGKVDLWAGTSAGGCNALAMAAGISPALALRFYQRRAPDIFGGRAWRNVLRAGLAPKFPDDWLNFALHEFFGNLRCEDLRTPALVTTHDLTNGQPAFFFTPHHPDLPVWELARMTMAAHTFFAPWRGHADGGLFHNDPSAVAWAVIGEHFPERMPAVRMFSLGSGMNKTLRDAATLNPILKTSWLRTIINDTLDGASVHEQRGVARRIADLVGAAYAVFEFPATDRDFDDARVVDWLRVQWGPQILECAAALNRFFGARP